MKNRLLRKQEVARFRGHCVATLYNRIKRGLFPAPVHLGPRIAAWPESEVRAVTAAEIGGASEDEIQLLVQDLVAQRTARRIAVTAPGPVASQKAERAPEVEVAHGE